LEAFARAVHNLTELRPEEIDFLTANCGAHPSLLHYGLEALVEHRRSGISSSDKVSLVPVYYDFAARAERLPMHILRDLRFDHRDNQHARFRLYSWARHQETWLQSILTTAPATAQDHKGLARSAMKLVGPNGAWDASDGRLRTWGLLVGDQGAYRLFSDFFAARLVQQMSADEELRNHVLAQIKAQLSQRELCVLDLFLKHPPREWSEDEIAEACWPPAERPLKPRAVPAAITRVQDKLEHDPYRVVGQIEKKGRGRGWELVRDRHDATRL